LDARQSPRPWIKAAYADTPRYRLRQTDVKSGHYERKVQALEQSRDQWETKYEEMAQKLAEKEAELKKLAEEIDAL